MSILRSSPIIQLMVAAAVLLLFIGCVSMPSSPERAVREGGRYRPESILVLDEVPKWTVEKLPAVDEWDSEVLV